MAAKEKVLETLKASEAPMRPGEIAEKAGLEKKEVDAAIKALKAEDALISPKRCFYAAK